MVMEAWGESLKNVLKKIAKTGHIDKELIKEIVKDIQRSLLRGDVEVKLALQLSKNVEKRALEEKPPSGMTHKDYLIKIIYEEIVSILGEKRELEIKPQTMMLVGLYGQGKTTSTGKLARFFQKKGFSVGLIAADVHRPAALDQLKQLGESLKIPVFGIAGEKKASTIVKKGMEHFKNQQIKIVDTSGRHALETDLIDEIKDLKKIAKPNEILLVIDATVGQQAGIQAKAFHDAVKVTGVFLSKLDGTAKGGGALSAVAVTNAPILFIGTGEHLYDLELFDPEGFVSKLLGMGDIKSLLETAKEIEMDEHQMEKTMEKMLSGKFNLKDMYEIWEQISKPGLLKKMLSAMPMFKMPGMDKLDGDLAENSEEKLKRYRTIMDSMTYEELENPEIIKSSRISRIARGSGKEETEVRELLKEHKKLKKAMKSFKGNRKMMRMLKRQMKTGDLEF